MPEFRTFFVIHFLISFFFHYFVLFVPGIDTQKSKLSKKLSILVKMRICYSLRGNPKFVSTTKGYQKKSSMILIDLIICDRGILPKMNEKEYDWRLKKRFEKWKLFKRLVSSILQKVTQIFQISTCLPPWRHFATAYAYVTFTNTEKFHGLVNLTIGRWFRRFCKALWDIFDKRNKRRHTH